MAVFTGTSGNDTITPGTVSPGVIRNPAGSFPGGGADRIGGGGGDDTLDGGGGNDTIYGGDGYDVVRGGAGNDYLHGSTEPDDDYFVDNLFGGAGNDTLVGGGAGTEMTGGSGNDTYIFQGLFDRAHEVAAGGTDTLILRVDLTDVGGEDLRLDANVENLTLAEGVAIATGRGNGLSNVITGNSGSNALYGYEGGDVLLGRGGHDSLAGGAGNDSLGGGAGNDTVRGDDGNDQLAGDDGNDQIAGGNGNDTIYSGAGADAASGGAGADSILGGAGQDSITGEGGNDTIQGGGGRDILVGGSGRDVFDFNAVSESPFGAARDELRPGGGVAVAFEGAGAAQGDLIDLSGIDANVNVAGNQAFVFGGTGIGRVWCVNEGTTTRVYANVDGDSAAEFQLDILDGGVLASAYGAGDFVL